jgi:hypothetical protein
MSSTSKNKISRNHKSKKTEPVKEYEHDPFFVEKDRQAKEFFDKHGFPEELLKILEERTKKKK